MSDGYPEFRLSIPYSSLKARGRLLEEIGTNGSQKFVILAGSYGREQAVPSFSTQAVSSHRTRQKLLADGSLVSSTAHPGFLEATTDIVCNSPSAAGEVLVGGSVNGFKQWVSPDNHPLGDFVSQAAWGPKRAWLVRGSQVSGANLVQRLWLAEGLVSLAAQRLRPGIPTPVSKEQIRQIVAEDYESTPYSRQHELVDEFHSFLSRMKTDDTVCTISGGRLRVGTISGDAYQVESDDDRSNLRRPVDWREADHAYEDLPEELQQKLSVQRDVVDLSMVQAVLDGLELSDAQISTLAEESESGSSGEHPVITARQPLELPVPDQSLADDLLVHDAAWLRELRDLLWDDRQMVLYGPPGTGKTYLALKLAEFLSGDPSRVKLVQFHPSYSYEDFFEGFRPQEDPETHEVALRITAGPLRELADLADREGSRHIPHFLIIDEINRANLAKVFGELYFLLEYRTRSVRLTYSGDDFALPKNLFVIGTMNTADRSIALVDAAMRRRFAFVELSPRVEPTSGLLRRWLAKEKHGSETADLLDALNDAIGDPAYQVGPSYLMRESLYSGSGGLERTWKTKILPLLEEYHFGEDVDVVQRYGLDALRAKVAGGAAPGGNASA
ncbi:DUF4357 domain-containing protein [Actinomadura parmotrematis]|uniref:DUF4357 domain-containing protein n=1 Tax=Actinomadura parmotrematis TaxID=2864039 RepID=A0ABS7FUH1_9ACTN|nr:DUF4357 domain-containing protein [Actinomadura parmotrematis]MBW8483941.1 DUF4357 domain-containing protein [Actinomadura parmotrematis]